MGIKPTIKGLGSFPFGSVLHFEFGSVPAARQFGSVRFGSTLRVRFGSSSKAVRFGSVRFDTSNSVRFQQQGSSVQFGSTLPVRFSSSSKAIRFGSVRHRPKIGFEFGVFGSGSVRFRSPNLFTENYAEARGFACISDYGMGTESATEGLGSLPFAQSYTSSSVRFEQPGSLIRFGFGQSDNWVRSARVVVAQKGFDFGMLGLGSVQF